MLSKPCALQCEVYGSSKSFAFYNEFGDAAAHVAYQNSVFYDVFVSDTPNFRIDKGTLRRPMQSPLYSLGIPRTSSGPLRAAL